MAGRHGEKPRQQTTVHWQDPKSTREYWCSGCETQNAAYAELEPGVAVPLTDTVNGVVRFFESIQLKEGVGGGGSWDATVTYNKSPNLKQHSFDIGVSNTKMLEGLELVSAYNCVGTPDVDDLEAGVIPNFGKSINVHDNQVNGVDVEIGRMEFQVDKLFQFSLLAPTYLKTVRDMSPTVNSEDFSLKWKGQVIPCPAGSLRFRGANAKQMAEDGLQMSFRFSYSKNITEDDSITIGTSFPIVKRGWDYLWPFYEDSTDNTSHRRIKIVRAVYVVRVYNYADFLLLNLDE